MVVIGTTQNRSENVFVLFKVLDSKGNELQLLTNRFDLDADEIAEIVQVTLGNRTVFQMDETTFEH